MTRARTTALLATVLLLGSAAVALSEPAGPALHDHAMHNPQAIPASWSDARVERFISDSDAKIDRWAGRVVKPGTSILHEGLPFTKSIPGMTLAQKRNCVWCPTRNACHNF